MTHKLPLVSVIIPTFQRSDYLVRAVQSVLNQTYSHIEIIIVNDNHGEDRYQKDILKKLSVEFVDSSFIYISHGTNKGLPVARNTGIQAARGEFIAFLDDDDEWLPEKIERQIQLFSSLSDNYGVIGCGWTLIHTVNQYTRRVFPNYRGDLSKVLALNHFSPPSMVLIRRKYLEVVKGFDENFKWRQDIELYYRLSHHCLFDFVDEVLATYYYHEGSMSRNFKEKLSAVDQFIQKHQPTLVHNHLPWSEIHERKGDLAAASGKLSIALESFLVAFVYRPGRVQILGKLILSFLGSSNYIKTRKL